MNTRWQHFMQKCIRGGRPHFQSEFQAGDIFHGGPSLDRRTLHLGQGTFIQVDGPDTFCIWEPRRKKGGRWIVQDGTSSLVSGTVANEAVHRCHSKPIATTEHYTPTATRGFELHPRHKNGLSPSVARCLFFSSLSFVPIMLCLPCSEASLRANQTENVWWRSLWVFLKGGLWTSLSEDMNPRGETTDQSQHLSPWDDQGSH